MTYTDNRDRFPSARTGQECSEDDPVAELEYLEQCFSSQMDKILKELGPQVRWLGRNGIDVDLEGIVTRAKEDFQDDTGHHLVSRW